MKLIFLFQKTVLSRGVRGGTIAPVLTPEALQFWPKSPQSGSQRPHLVHIEEFYDIEKIHQNLSPKEPLRGASK